MAASYSIWMTRSHGLMRLMDAQPLNKQLDLAVGQLFMFNALKIQIQQMLLHMDNLYVS